MTLATFWLLIKETAIGWDRDHIARHSAALSFYTLFSMAPLLLIVIAIAGSVFGREAVEGRIMEELQLLVGSSGARTVQGVIRNSSGPGKSVTALTIGIVTFFFGATAAFASLQGALNSVWKVESRPGNAIWSFVRTRLISFGMVVGTGFLLLVSLVVGAGLSAMSDALGQVIPGPVGLWQAADVVISLSIITVLFGAIYKVLPDVELTWSDVWRGAVITSVFFTAGKFLIGLFLGQSSVASSYGAAGSLVVLLLWVYYSTQVMLLGAEFTQKYVLQFRRGIPVSPHAAKPGEPPGGVAPGTE